MFRLQGGWLKYRPQDTFKLPRIVEATHEVVTAAHGPGPVIDESHREPITVPLCDKSGNVRATRKLYRLQWPGELRTRRDEQGLRVPGEVHWDDEVPKAILGNLDFREVDRKWREAAAADAVGVYVKPEAIRHRHPEVEELLASSTSCSLRDLVCRGPLPLPDELPSEIAYHLAVNARHYYPEERGKPSVHDLAGILDGAEVPTAKHARHPVRALPEARVEQVLSSRFALDQSALATLNYLKWMAEGHQEHPLLRNFDTCIGDRLHQMAVTPTQLYFWLLQDYLYDMEKRYWQRGESRHHWWQLAGYLFWVGRTGGGAVARLAGMEPGRFDLSSALKTVAGPLEYIREDCPDVVQRHSEYEEGDFYKLSHVDGLKLDLGDKGEPVQGKKPHDLEPPTHSTLPGDDPTAPVSVPSLDARLLQQIQGILGSGVTTAALANPGAMHSGDIIINLHLFERMFIAAMLVKQRNEYTVSPEWLADGFTVEELEQGLVEAKRRRSACATS